MASATHKTTESMLTPYIKALSAYGRTLPAVSGSSGTAKRPTGVVIRSREPNVQAPGIKRVGGRPPAEHIVKMLVSRMTTEGIKYKPGGVPEPHIKTPVIHPGKALTLRKVKAIHLGHPTVKKVVA